MDQRDLQAELKTVCPNVYFQPPSDTKLLYPAIVYTRSNIDIKYADNHVQQYKWRYTVTVIQETPSQTLLDNLLQLLQYTSFDSAYIADRLYHTVFNIYF